MRHYFIFIIILFCSCRGYDKTKSTEFFLIDSAKSNTGVYEAFVVYNAPKDTMLLLKMVENYNLRTISVDSLRLYKRYIRTFYSNSKFLTRDFESGARDTNPNSPYTYQELNNFMDHQLITIEYDQYYYDRKYQYTYYFKRNFENDHSFVVYDLDSLYRAKWIETADIDTTMVR